MSGRADSDDPPLVERVDAADDAHEGEDADAGDDTHEGDGTHEGDDTHEGGNADAGEDIDAGEDAHEGEDDDFEHDVRRARWTALGTGAVLALAGAAAAVLRLTGSAPPLVPVAYACGAAVCALAAVLGSRGRTRRALWLLIAGLMTMALGDQFD
ncbi:hypothetical protein SHKM778_19550 [Streptomyces sp. KM77-8]|uniref:Uncharacterized protein n=1 Tax=Streptomyces haneummycinicus TaxID=3074435 RepID=A0AAT9HDZ6_9ACTN